MEILSQNWDMHFYSYSIIFTLFLKILASKAKKSVDRLPTFEHFEIKAKSLVGARLLASVLGQKFQKLAIVQSKLAPARAALGSYTSAVPIRARVCNSPPHSELLK